MVRLTRVVRLKADATTWVAEVSGFSRTCRGELVASGRRQSR
jgi:hypothetical protein